MHVEWKRRAVQYGQEAVLPSFFWYKINRKLVCIIRGSLRESGKLILCLSDRDILELIEIKERNEQPTEAFFGAMLDDLLIHLEK